LFIVCFSDAAEATTAAAKVINSSSSLCIFLDFRYTLNKKVDTLHIFKLEKVHISDALPLEADEAACPVCRSRRHGNNACFLDT